MKVFRVWFCLFLGISLILSVGVVRADSEENSSRIQNLETRVDNLENQRSGYDGVLPIAASAFQGVPYRDIRIYSTGTGIRPLDYYTDAIAHAPVPLPFKCTIIGVEAAVRNISDTSEVIVELHDGECLNAVCDTLVPIVSFDTSDEEPSSNTVVINSPAFSYEYDPANLYKFPLWVTVRLHDYSTTRQKLNWAKIYYTVP